MSDFDAVISRVQQLLPLVDQLAKLGCEVAVHIEFDEHSIELAAPVRRGEGELRYVSIDEAVSIADEVDPSVAADPGYWEHRARDQRQ